MSRISEQTYPGHPLVIAVRIMENFPSLEAATERGHHFSAAQESPMIRGGGASVAAALEILKLMAREEDGLSQEKAIEVANQNWDLNRSGIGEEKYAAGVREAEAAKEDFLSMTSWWLPQPHAKFVGR